MEQLGNKFIVRMEARLKNGVLIRVRERLGLTQVQMAKLFGVNKTTYAQVELMNRMPSQHFAQALCDFVNDHGENVTIDELFPEQLKELGTNNKIIREREIPSGLLPNMKKRNILEYKTGSDKEHISNTIKEGLSILTEREREIIKYRYPMNKHEPIMSYEEISHRVHYSRERIRQIEVEALQKMSLHFGRYNKIKPTYLVYYCEKCGKRFRVYDFENKLDEKKICDRCKVEWATE